VAGKNGVNMQGRIQRSQRTGDWELGLPRGRPSGLKITNCKMQIENLEQREERHRGRSLQMTP